MKWSWFINERSLENEIPWKSWLDLRFPWRSERKWILKWLPPNRGHFNFIFVNEDGLLINFGVCIFLAVILLYCFNHFGITMHSPLVKMFSALILLTHNPSTRGNVEILVGSSVSSSPLVKMKFKLNASQ